MKTIMAKTSQDMASKRQFHWRSKVTNEGEEVVPSLKNLISTTVAEEGKQENNKVPGFNPPEVPNFKCSSKSIGEEEKTENGKVPEPEQTTSSFTSQKKKLQSIAVSRLRSVLTAFGKNRVHFQHGLGPKVVGTLFGYRRGHVHFVFQKDPNLRPAFLVELATPITGLVREMASGLVRIALECDKEEEKKSTRLLEEPVWRTYCNGKKCGFAARRECGEKEWKILKAVEPISMGAGVLPSQGDEAESDGELIYMRAKFERVVGSRDSEAFYMMNPDSNGAPELSIYLLRV